MDNVRSIDIDPDIKQIDGPQSIIYLHHLTGPFTIDKDFLEIDADKKEKYKILVFEHCNDMTILIERKLLKLMFIRSDKIIIQAKKPLIGSIDLFKTTDVNIILEENIPFVDIEQSTGVTCQVRHDESWWVIVTQSFSIQLITSQKNIHRFDVSMWPIQNYFKCDRNKLISHSTKDLTPINQELKQYIYSPLKTWND